MAAYRRVDDLTVTCRLTACTPRSAPGPTLGIEYGKPLPLPFYRLKQDRRHSSWPGKLDHRPAIVYKCPVLRY